MAKFTVTLDWAERAVDGADGRRVYAGIDEADDRTGDGHCGRSIGAGRHSVEIEKLVKSAQLGEVDDLRSGQHRNVGGAVVDGDSGNQ